ncbi:MAG: hypothetical protein L7H01_06980 [Sulfolobales archaeon]|nr:hypothetical protein [Sulfolobales archaeon]
MRAAFTKFVISSCAPRNCNDIWNGESSTTRIPPTFTCHQYRGTKVTKIPAK